MAHLRRRLSSRGVKSAADVEKSREGERVRIAGAIIVRQRPGTAKGVLFITLEDETGMVQAIVSPELMNEHRQILFGHSGLVVEGLLQRRDGSISVQARRFWPLELTSAKSHDFH